MLPLRLLLRSSLRPISLRLPPLLPRTFTTTPALLTTIYDYATIKSLCASPRPHTYIIDVREPHEYTAGCIPGAINVPIASQPDAFSLPDEEFEDRFGFEKPLRGRDTVVFYCKAGVRSKAAAELARREGLEVAEYPGSWREWSEREGK